MKTSLVVLVLLPFWVNFRYWKYPVAPHEWLLGWILISCRCLLWNKKASKDGIWILDWSPGCFCSDADLWLFSHLTNGIILSEFKLLLALSLQSFFALGPLLFHLSLHLFFPHSHCSLHPRSQTAWLNTQAKCVALQRDSGSRYSGSGPGSKWRVIVARCGYTSYRPQ